MTQEVSTPASGVAATTTDGYAPAKSAQPHAVSAQTVTTSAGSTTTNYGYNADGQLTSESGAATDSMTWSPAGQLASMTTSAGATSYTYDADGNLLIQKDPSSTTLYLPDEEITLAGSTLSGTRYYQLGGQTVAARTGTGSVYYLTGDQEGTQTLAINSSTLAVSERFYDPYGNPTGTAVGAWPGAQGFQDGTTDSATGLTNLGAREYDSGTGAFASPDPLLNPTDPQDLNPYAYAQDSPPTGQDPTGQYASYVTSSGNYVGTSQSYETMEYDQTIPYVPSYGFQDWNPYIDGNPGRAASGGSDGSRPTPAPAVHHSPQPTQHSGGCSGLGCVGGFLSGAAGDIGHGAADAGGIVINAGGAISGFGGSVANAGSGIPILGSLYALDGRAISLYGNAISNIGQILCGGNSFTQDTRVLLAHGKTAPIDTLKPGDKVLATNTKTSKTQPETVSAVLAHYDTNLYDLKVQSGKHIEIIHTTSNHLFWDPYPHYWVNAEQTTSKGSTSRRPTASQPTVVGGTVPKQSTTAGCGTSPSPATTTTTSTSSPHGN